ncbi:MAG: gliding motility-associated C-terminal domain-containing protein, partial [Flavobacteriales bacterium]|nr:gliding motility-associated C-terminal domain-containing protein [Flavobacteriales bacterium]
YSSDSIYIQIDSCNINEISNIFTPNGDGLNDFFFIKNLEQFPNSKLEVFNRWGNLVYSDNNYQNDWDGDEQKTGTYFYIFYPNDLSGRAQLQKGFISLIR